MIGSEACNGETRSWGFRKCRGCHGFHVFNGLNKVHEHAVYGRVIWNPRNFSDGHPEYVCFKKLFVDRQKLFARPPKFATYSDRTSSRAVEEVHMISLNDIQIGTKIDKEFGGEIFTGEVVEHFAAENLYAVVYTDGDQEDLSSQEVVECSNLH